MLVSNNQEIMRGLSRKQIEERNGLDELASAREVFPSRGFKLKDCVSHSNV